MSERLILTLAILGGTGRVGPGLAYRWSKAGYHVIIGSRTPEKAKRVAQEVNERLNRDVVHGMANEEAVEACDIAVLTVPYEAQKATLETLKDRLQGKVLVVTTVPLVPPNVSLVQLPEAGSATKEAQETLGEGVNVVAAFQNVAEVHLKEDHPIPCDVLVCGNSEDAREQVLRLVAAAKLVGWDAGPLQNAAIVEGLSSILIGINERYKIKGAGIRVTGDPVEDRSSS
ncbi:MAG: F420-dependent NADP reductase [Anaerolineae bacterium SM23_ 63]|nr:MAG: F420-dependent NADP reductase [Anaerolineae bacterium SM23_ 63]HEY47461.1 NADPH-dependent F420 reductase [Anaerolineae bacterium]